MFPNALYELSINLTLKLEKDREKKAGGEMSYHYQVPAYTKLIFFQMSGQTP